MNTNSRFAVAVHTLGLMAFTEDHDSVTSDDIAASVNTNPVVIRRLLGSLREAGLVTSQPGPGGGWRLVRRPEAITLRDVYRAIEADALFSLPHRPPSATCLVGSNVQHVLDHYFKEAELALEGHLAKHTLGEVLTDIARSIGPCARRAARRAVVA